MTNEERLMAAGWRWVPGFGDLWCHDGTGEDLYTEDEALVVVLTAERDAAIARAESLMQQRDEARSAIVLCAEFHQEREAALEARAEAAEALAASRPEISREDAALAYEMLRVRGPGGQSANAHTIARDNVLDALRAHAAKVSR